MALLKKTIKGKETRDILARGLTQVADIVSTTAGAAGRNVSISKQWGAPQITKDGVTVAKSVVLAGVEGDGAKLLIEAADKTAREAGDGTTATCILAREIVKAGLKHIKAGVKPTYVKRGIDMATELVVAELQKRTQPITSEEQLADVATISANGDKKLGVMIANAMTKVGKFGSVIVESSQTNETTVEITDGIRIDSGCLSPYFFTNMEKQQCELKNPYVLLYDGVLSNMKSMLPWLEAIVATPEPNLLIICDDVDNEVLSTMITNKLKGVFNVCIVKAPSVGDFRTGLMDDIACCTGGEYISRELGITQDKIDIEMLGRCTSAIITPTETIIRQDKTGINASIQLDIEERIKMLQNTIETTDSEYIIETTKERISKLTDGIAVIRIAGKTESELSEKKDRVDDAICATRSAREEGIMAGGGIALHRIREIVYNNIKHQKGEYDKDVYTGMMILLNSLSAPFEQIVFNTGVSVYRTKRLVNKAYEFDMGFDALTCEIRNLKKAGIIDAKKVIRCALQNAASIAGTILTVDGIVTDDYEKMIEFNQLLKNNG